MKNKKLSKDKIVAILNKHGFLGHHEWRFNYDDKVFSLYYLDFYLDTYIVRAIAKAYLRLEAKQAKPKGVKIQGIAEGEKVLVMDFNDNKRLTAKEVAEGLVSRIKATSNMIDIINNESTKQKTDLDFLKESIEIVELADGIRASIVDAMLDGKKQEIMKAIAENNNAGEGIQYYDIIKCTAIQHIVHSGYPLVPETLTCMLNANHQTQHCATDQKGNRINWS